jgi:hypothetical protein
MIVDYVKKELFFLRTCSSGAIPARRFHKEVV